MSLSLALDARLWQPDQFASLEATHPSIYLGLKSCLSAYSRLDLAALLALIAARDSTAVAATRAKGEAALHTATIVGGMLSQLVAKAEKAVADSGPAAAPALVTLLEAARRNRDAFLVEAPARVGEALASSPEYQQLRAAAFDAVNTAAAQLEAMRLRSDNPATPFRELQPLVERLKELWAGLDRALAPLSREQQEAIRRPLAERLSAAAKALTTNLYTRKAADRAAGAYPPPVINPGGTVPEQFAAALASGNYSAAATLLAPWLATAWPASRLKEEMERSAEEILAGFEIVTAPRPGGYDVGANPLELAELKDDGTEQLPDEITEQNFRGWWPTQILTEEEDAWLTDIGYLANYFVIVVEVDGKERIGYVRFESWPV